MIARNQPFLWFDGNAEEAARYYAETFSDTRIDAITHAPGDYRTRQKGDVLAVEMTIFGMPFVLLNREPRFDEAVGVRIC